MTPGTLQTPPPPLPAQFLSAITEPPLVIMVLACPTPPICGAANLRCCQSVVLACLTLPICGRADEIDSATWQQQPQADMHATLMHCFLQLIREQHAQRAQLAKRGHTQALRLPFSASMPCCRSAPSTSVSHSMRPCASHNVWSCIHTALQIFCAAPGLRHVMSYQHALLCAVRPHQQQKPTALAACSV